MSSIFELNRRVRKSNAFVLAWCKVQYDEIEIHQKYLNESANQIASEFVKLCANYLEFIHTHLRNAQESYDAVQSVSVATKGAYVNALNSFPFDREATLHADQSHVPTMRKHENSRSMNFRM
jgi:DNA anti-recombination protein RmuC